jgi:hypothetical protein
MNPEGVSPGEILDPLEVESKDTFPGWDACLTPWGCFDLPSGFSIVEDDGNRVLEWIGEGWERALVTGGGLWRDYSVSASVLPIETSGSPNTDRNDWQESLAGIVFRVKTSRFYYHFGIEGRRRIVLYRRTDDEWLELAGSDIQLPDGYLELCVELDGDGIRCSCERLGIEFFVTDTRFPTGRVGLRAMGRSRCSGARVFMTPSQKRTLNRIGRSMDQRQAELGRDIPGEKLIQTFDLSEIGGSIQFTDFARPNVYDMLVTGEDFTRGVSIDGEVLWELEEQLSSVLASSERDKDGRILYGFAGIRRKDEMKAITGGSVSAGIPREICRVKGDTGEVEARIEVPEMGDDVRRVTLTTHTGRLTGDGASDFVLREWSANYGHGGVNLWAYDRDLELLWKSRVNPPYGHAHALQFIDIDGDGRDEVLVGGTMFSPDGEVLWVHDRADEISKIHGAHHYDAVTIGDLSGDESTDPVAFLIGGSAGVYVVDGLTGKTRMVHRVGHAQGRHVGKLRKDLPGREVLVACRWGNMGILTLFSGNGDRLWSIQPDYKGQGSVPMTWGGREEQLIWANTTSEVQSFYDGYGRKVKDLPRIRELYGGRMNREVGAMVVRMGDDPRDLLGLRVEDSLYVFGPE